MLDRGRGELIVHVSASKRSADAVALLDILDVRYAPKPGRAAVPVVLALDHGPIHARRPTRAVLAKRLWLIVEWLPNYVPKLDDIAYLKPHLLAHRTFPSVEHLGFATKHAIIEPNRERSRQICHGHRIAA